MHEGGEPFDINYIIKELQILIINISHVCMLIIINKGVYVI